MIPRIRGWIVPKPLAAELVEHARHLQSQGARFPVLACAFFARERDLALDATHAHSLAEVFGRTADEILSVFGLVEAAVDRGSMRACHGVSCRSVGADELQSEVLAGSGIQLDVVLCLNNCDRGPSCEIDGRLYCGTDDAVTLEERSWRD